MSHTFPHTVASQENANEYETLDTATGLPVAAEAGRVGFEATPKEGVCSSVVVPQSEEQGRVARLLRFVARTVAHNLAHGLTARRRS